MEDSRRYQLRMSISLLMNNFIKFFQNLIAIEKRSLERNKDSYYVGKVREFTQKNLEKFDQTFDKIKCVLNSITEINDMDIGQEEAKMEQTLCILLKLFEIDKYGRPTFKNKSFLGMSEDELFNNTNLDLEMVEMKREQILAQRYLGVVEEQLEKADMEMQNILKNKTGSIFRLSSLIGGTDNLVEIWKKYKEKIRSIDYLNRKGDNLLLTGEGWYSIDPVEISKILRFCKKCPLKPDGFCIDFDKRIRIDYEILFNEDSEESQLLSRTNLNIFLLMNTVEEMLDKNIRFEKLLEDWRHMFRLKFDIIHLKPELLAKINIEVTYKANIILEFVEKWAKKKSSAEKIIAEFKKVKERENKELFAMRDKLEKEQSLKDEEFDEWLKNQNASSLSSRFQNIHIEQLAKLAEEDLHKKNINEAKTFDFWLFLKQFLLNRDNKIITRLRILLNDNGILKLMKKIGEYYSKLPKIEEQQSTGKKSTKGKKKKKTTAGQPAQEEEELQIDVITDESSNREEKVSSEESLLGKDLNVQKNPLNIQQILEHLTRTSAIAADKSHSSGNDVEMGDNPTIANSPTAESSSANVPPILNEMYQYALTETDLESVLNTNEKLRIPVIDAYLEILTRDNAKNFGLIPSYVIHYFRAEGQFPPEWLQNKIDQQGIVDNVKYWLIPAHLNADHWVLTVMDVNERRLHYFDSFSPGSTNEEFTIDIFVMLPNLYTLCGHYHKGQQFISHDITSTNSRNDLPIQKNMIDCGVFMLMFAWDIFEQNSLNAKMQITQSGVKEARNQIYRQLAYGFGIEIDENMLENLNFLPSSPELTPPTSPAKSIPKSLKKESQSETEQASSKILPHSKLERLRSIHEIPKEEPNDHELYLLKNKYNRLIFANDKDPRKLQIMVNFAITLIHFKKLTGSILMEFEQNHMANADETFGIELYNKFDEYLELVKLEIDENIEPYACIFFKFFMQLRRNKILTMNEDWNKYVRFRMRHFYWIDPEWDENENLLLKNIIMEQNGKCNNAEIKQFSKKFANVQTYSNISYYWTLKLLLQNSPEFIEQFNKISGEQLLILKKRIFDLIGENGFEKLEMAIPALKFNVCINEMTRNNITRYFSGGLKGMKYEFRHSLAYLLNHFFHFRANCIESGLSEYKQKMDEIYEQIVEVKLVKLIDEEHTLEEEVNELKEELCIFLKFFEITEEFSDEKFFSFNYEEVLQCTANEFETIWERQHHNLLEAYNNDSIEKLLSAGDKDLENILKHKEGAIYRLKLFTGYENFLKLMDNYGENIRDKKYFTNTIDQIRQSFEMFMTTKDDHIQQMNRAKLKIYILMRWLYQTLQNKRIFGKFLSILHQGFRLALDELNVNPKNVNNIEIDITLRGEKIIEFVKKWIKKAKNEIKIQNEYTTLQNDCDNFFAHYVEWSKDVPPLQDEFQLIHVLTLQELANQDKNMSKTKTDDMEKGIEINFWQYFNDLHNFPDRITLIGELLNINALKQLYELLGIKFIESRFSQLGKLPKSKNEIETEEGNTLQKNLPRSDSQQEVELSKSAKNKKKKSKMNKTATDEEEKIGIKESEQQKMENVQEIPPEITLKGKENLKELMGQQSQLYEDEQNASNISLKPKLERLRSIHEIPKEVKIRKNQYSKSFVQVLGQLEEMIHDTDLIAIKEAEMIKDVYYRVIFAQQDYNEPKHMHMNNANVKIALFHFKKLASSMLTQFKRSHMVKVDAIFRKEIEAKYAEYQKLFQLDLGDNIGNYACIFFKFFMQLRRNKILTMNEEWNKYVRFRMRHFYWIDPEWDENENLLLKNVIMEQKENCNIDEVKQFSKNVANVRPYSNISHYWTLKWLLQNSPEFIELVEKCEETQLFRIKNCILILLGENGFEKLEIAIPALKFNICLQEMARISITRYLIGGLEGTKHEFRHSLSCFLYLFSLFRGNCIDSGWLKVKTLKANIQKMDKIYEQIVGNKLVKLIDEEHTLEEEIYELRESLCILLKFFEYKEEDSTAAITEEKVFSINYEQAMKCTTEEFETILERQRFLLQSYNNKLIKIYLSAGSTDLESVLKYKEGAIYRLKELIGSDNFHKLWNQQLENIRDKKYFANTLDQIRQSFEMFMSTKDDHIRQLNRTKLKIYILMRWLYQTLQNKRIFGKFLSILHQGFRLALDELNVNPKNVNNIEIDITLRGEKIIEFVKKWIKKAKNEIKIQNEYTTLQNDCDNFFAHYLEWSKDVPPLQDEFQLIHVLTLEELTNQDKNMSKANTENMEKGKVEINFWQYFDDLHNFPDRIARIGELLNINSLKHLYELLGLNFIESQFSQFQLADLSMPGSENEKEKNLPPSNSLQQEGELSKSAKKKLKNKLKVSKTSTDDEIKQSESEKEKIESLQEIPPEKIVIRKQSDQYKDEQKASNKLPKAQFMSSPSKNTRPRQRSIRKLKKDNENKEEEKLRKNIFQSLSSQQLNLEQIYFNTGFFHYKHLSWSILLDFDKSKFDAKQLVQYDERKKEHLNLLIQSSDLFEKDACRFYKFLIRLKNDNILTKNEEWNAYYKFRMRHFYWIDAEWEKNNDEILTNLKLNKSNCTSNEYEHFISFYTSPPQSQISNYWCLKWLLNNSPEFDKEINNLNRQDLMNFKQNIYELIGHDGFYYLELIAPDVIKKEKPLTMFTIECIKRVLNSERPKRNELRMALNYLLNTALSFRDKLAELEEVAIDEDRNFFKDNIVKFDNIYAKISEKLNSLVDEEQSQEEEEIILSHAVCITLKFHEINEAKWEVIMITIENFGVKTYEEFVDCSEEEMEKSINRQGIVLFKNNYAIIENHLVNDMEMQSILQFTGGSICKLNELIGGFNNLNKLWHLHPNLIRSETFFTGQHVEDYLRKYYHKFLCSPNPNTRYIHKITVNIYAFMKSIESMVGQDKSYNILIENWRCDFRYWLDNLYLYPQLAENVGMEVAIMPAKIVAFIKKTKKQTKQKDPMQLAHDFKNDELDEEKEFFKRIKQNLPEPMLSQDLQKIHVENLQTFAIEDRDNSEKDSTNIWHFFQELHNFPEQIAQISQILDKGNIRILYQKLGLKFHEEKFPESRIEELTKDEKIDTSKKGNNKKKAGKKEQPSTPALAGKSSQKKQISDSTSENLPKGKTLLEGKESTKEEGGKSPKEKKLKESTKEEGRKSPKEKKLKESTKEEGGKSPKEKKLKESTKEEGGKSPKEKKLKESTKEEGGKSPKEKKLKESTKGEGGKSPKEKKLKESTKEEGGKSPKEKKLKESTKGEGGKSPKEKKLERKESGKEISGTSPKGKTEGISSPNGKSHKIMEESNVNKNKRKEEEKQRESQSFEKIEKLNILNDYKFEDLMQMDTLNLHYKELMKEPNNEEKRRLTDITVFAVEIGQRLKALEISKKLWTDKINLENIRQEVNNFVINKFKHMDELEEALYNLLKRIEFAMENPINMEKNEENKNIFKMRKQLHKLRLSWIIQQNDSNWQQNVEKEDLNQILLALNLETEKKFNEEIKIWETILGQIKLDHELYSEREIKGRGGMEVIDFAKYSQQLCFDDDQNKKEEELTERLIEEFKFVDVKEIEQGKPIKYLWMRKYMETKERVINLVKEWHSSAEILFTGSHLLGTMTSRSDMDTIVVTHDVQIHEYNQKAECIIEEIGFNNEKMKMERRRQCQNDQLFLCKFCKMSRVISADRIPGSLELVKAFVCADENYESKSFNECKYKVKVDFLFATLLKKDHLSILKRKEVKSDEIDEILVVLYRLYSSRASFLALLGFRDNIRILEQFPNDARNFRIACAALKLWAKRNNIYGPKLGFLKGVHMNLLMVKIYLRYPSASVSFLIEQFFATYIVWPWPLPVQLLKISKLTYEKSGIGSQNLLWYEKEPNAEMPIISPGFIESNKASDVDRYTKSIMRTFMSEGLKQIREIRAGKVKPIGGNEWHDFMRGNDLSQRYAHFLVVNCLTKVNEGTFGDDFCAITSLKMHDFIPTDIGKLLPKEIRWYHIIEAGSRKECLINRNGYEDISKYKCDIWLVGLQLKKDKQIDPEEMINLENTKEMNEAKEKIYNDYYEYKKRFNKTIGEEHKNSLTGNLLLSINYVGVNDLYKWNIMLRGWEIIVKN